MVLMAGACIPIGRNDHRRLRRVKYMNRNIWLDGIVGVIIGDALGSPAQFRRRQYFEERPITKMEACSIFDTPPGSWTDDSSLTLATLDSLITSKGYNINHIAERFVSWLNKGEYTPFGRAYDIGSGCKSGIEKYNITKDPYTSGSDDQMNNGNGSLMRIMPICIYSYLMNTCDKWTTDECLKVIHDTSGITHRHLRAQMACGFYFFMIKHILNDRDNKSLKVCMQEGIKEGYEYYSRNDSDISEREFFKRIIDVERLSGIDPYAIKSSGYVIDTIEAVVWSIITTSTYKECELKAVNLGGDADTVGAIAGGFAGLYYGYESIPKEWISEIQRIEWIEEMCKEAGSIFL